MQSPEERSERQRQRDRERERKRIMRVGERERYRAATVSMCVYVCVVSLWCRVLRLGFLYGDSSRDPTPTLLLPHRVKGWCGYVPFFSPACSDEGVIQPPETQRNQNNTLTTLLSLFTFSFSLLPPLVMLFLTLLRSLLSHQHPTTKNKDG
ncbi:hypothetical protein AMECASPLE_016899, partial [Ameca splendens]